MIGLGSRPILREAPVTNPEGGSQGPPISLLLSPTTQEDLRLDAYLECPHAALRCYTLRNIHAFSPVFTPGPFGTAVNVTNHYPVCVTTPVAMVTNSRPALSNRLCRPTTGNSCECISYLIAENGLSKENKIASIEYNIEDLSCDGDGVMKCKDYCVEMYEELTENGKICTVMPGDNRKIADWMCEALKQNVCNARGLKLVHTAAASGSHKALTQSRIESNWDRMTDKGKSFHPASSIRSTSSIIVSEQE
ncbi:uncharacterized protein TNCV_717401 [Trichonephila clavipes]|nr:uncharacterized protein TNCV_717401 [Trichonephila clavipes]